MVLVYLIISLWAKDYMRIISYFGALLIVLPLLVTSTFSIASEMVKDFSFNDIYGDSHKFSDYKGKWVLVNYWATYCSPCLAEIPDINRFALANKDTFVSLGFDAGGSSPHEIEDFKKELNVSYLLAPNQESTMLAFGIVMAIPTSYIISPKGEIVDKFVGIITYKDLDYYVNPVKPKKKKLSK